MGSSGRGSMRVEKVVEKPTILPCRRCAKQLLPDGVCWGCRGWAQFRERYLIVLHGEIVGQHYKRSTADASLADIRATVNEAAYMLIKG